LVNYAVKRKLSEPIGFDIPVPASGTKKTEVMTDGQMDAFFTECDRCPHPVVGMILKFELLTLMRAEEARGLLWEEVDIQRGALKISDPKSGEDEFQALDPAAVDILRALPRDKANPYVFQGEMGKGKSGMIGKTTVLKYGRKIMNAIGLPDTFRPNHGLRHTGASTMASSGEVDIYTLSNMLRHRSLSMTKRYAHLADQRQRQAANVLGRLVKKVEGTEEADNG
jgi:integrase